MGGLELSEEVPRPAERAKRLPRAVRERQILDAAVSVFSRYGYHSASMDEISEVAGVSKPMIYTYLGSKEDLFGACIRREATRLLEAVQNGIKPDLPPDMQLWHGLRAFYRFVADYRESWTVLHRQAMTVGGAFAAEITDMRTRAIELVAALVVSAGDPQGPRRAGRVLRRRALRRAGRGGRIAGRLGARPPRCLRRRARLVADEPGLARIQRPGRGRDLEAVRERRLSPPGAASACGRSTAQMPSRHLHSTW